MRTKFASKFASINAEYDAQDYLAAKRAELIEPDYDAIPAELRERRQWVGMFLELRQNKAYSKPAKVPIRADSGIRADTSNPKEWSSFDAAVAARERFSLDGIGYVPSKDDPFVFLDFDDCRDALIDIIEPVVADLIRAFGTYAEISCSGTGVHVILRGKMPGSRKRGKLDGINVEMYESGQFLVMTGRTLS